MIRKRRVMLGALALSVGLVAVWQGGFHGLPPTVILFPPPEEPVYLPVLDQRADLDVVQVPLSQALRTLSQQHQVEIVLDQDALQPLGVTGHEPVMCQLRGVPLRRLIELLGGQVDRRLMVTWPDGRIHVSTNLACGQKSNYIARVYRLTELLATTGGLDGRDLAELVNQIGPPSSWATGGGLGSVEALPGALLVAQTPDVHRQIQLCLAQLVQHPSCDPLTPIDTSDPHPDATADVMRMLQRDVQFKLAGVPLTKVLSQIADRMRIPIWIDTPGGKVALVESERTVSCSLPRMPLRAALQEILEPLGRCYSVRGGVLTVTHRSPDDTFTRLYPVQDLVLPASPRMLTAEPLDADCRGDYHSLATLVARHVRPDIWSALGNQGISGGNGCLIVRTTWKSHQEVQRFLAAVREARQASSRADQPLGVATNGDDRIEWTLREEVSLRFKNAGLSDIAKELEHRFQIPVRLVWGSEAAVTYSTKDESLEDGLCEVLDLSESAFAVQDGKMLITIRPNAIETRFHPARRFALSDPRCNDIRDVARIAAELAPRTPYPDAEIDAWQDLLVVTQSREQHRQLAALLDAIERIRDEPSPAAMVRVPRRNDKAHEVRVYRLAGVWQPSIAAAARASGRPRRADVDRWCTAWGALPNLPPGMCILRGQRLEPQRSLGGMGLIGGIPSFRVDAALIPFARPQRPPVRIDPSATQVGQWICALVEPLSWAPPVYVCDSQFSYASDAGVLAVLQDLLVVRQTSAVHDQIYRFLAFLRELDGLPRPWELDQVQTGAWQAELVRKARTIDDPLKRRYVFACLAMIAEPNAEVVQLVGELLSGPDFCSRPDDAYCVGLLIHRLLTSAPSPDEELVRLVSSGAQRRQAILALVAVGDPAAESLSRVLQRPSGACTLALKSLGPHRLNPEYSLPRWLRWLAPVPNDVTLEIIGALDPSGRRAYAVIERWRREPGDLSPDRIEQTQEALDSYFRQEPQPEAKL